MSSLRTNRKLISLDDMFGNAGEDTPGKSGIQAVGEPGRSADPMYLPVTKLYPKKNHKFQVNLGKKNDDLLQSIREFGVLEPVIVRPMEQQGEAGAYEILAGHRRTVMAREAGLTEIPVVIKTGLSETEADLIETETNLLQRSWEDMSHSERAEVLYAHYNAVNQQGVRTGFLEEINAEIKCLAKPVNSMAEEGLSQVATKGNLRTSGAAYELSKDTVARYLRIYTLSNELKDRMDLDEVAFVAGVEISYLTPEHQKFLDTLLEAYKLDIQKAKVLRALEMQGKLQEDSMKEILAGKKMKKPGRPKAVKISPNIINRYFEAGTNQKEIEETIEAALEAYFKER